MPASKIQFYSENINFQLPKKTIIRKWIQEVIDEKGFKQGPIAIIFCDDEYLHKMNLQYLNHDTLTDIISFDYTEGKVVSGDLFISYERVKENSKKIKIPAIQELQRVMIHGVLHLLGFKDKSPKDKKAMTFEEDKALSKLKML